MHSKNEETQQKLIDFISTKEGYLKLKIATLELQSAAAKDELKKLERDRFKKRKLRKGSISDAVKKACLSKKGGCNHD